MSDLPTRETVQKPDQGTDLPRYLEDIALPVIRAYQDRVLMTRYEWEESLMIDMERCGKAFKAIAPEWYAVIPSHMIEAMMHGILDAALGDTE